MSIDDPEKVEVLATLKDEGVVAVRQNNLMVTSFHPELTDDLSFHHFFVQNILNKQAIPN